MQKFNYFLLIAFTTLLSSIKLSAFTTPTINSFDMERIDIVAPLFPDGVTSLYAIDDLHFKFEELQLVTTNSSNFIQNNLTILYALCFALCLFNLIAQIKIIVQMIHLFFQFRKKDDAVRLNF